MGMDCICWGLEAGGIPSLGWLGVVTAAVPIVGEKMTPGELKQ